MKTIVEILRAARQLLIDRGWTQGTFARDAKGARTLYDAPDAVCYCSLGAIMVVGRGFAPEASTLALTKAIGSGHPANVAEWNDAKDRTKEEVLAAYDRAIVLAEEMTWV